MQTESDNQVLLLKHIERLRDCCPNVTEIVKYTTYEIPLNIPQYSQPLYLVVELEKRKFPQSPPRIVLSAHSLTTPPPFTPQGVLQTPLIHRLLLADGTVRADAHPKLQQWTLHNDLGLVIRDLVTLFRNEPPRFADATTSPALPSTATTTAVSPPTSVASSTLSFSATSFQVPDLRSKSLREVNELLTNEAKFQAWFSALDQVRNTSALRDSLRSNNKETANKNERSRKELEVVRKEVETQMNRLQEARETFNQLSRRREELMRRYSTEALVARLTHLCEQSDAESKDLLLQFLGPRAASLFTSSLTATSPLRNIPPSLSSSSASSSSMSKVSPYDFVSQYLVKRSLFHLRSLKRDSLRVVPVPPSPPDHTTPAQLATVAIPSSTSPPPPTFLRTL
jgi:hypothetical protein